MSSNATFTHPATNRDEARTLTGSEPAVREWTIPIVGAFDPARAGEVEKGLLAVEGVSGVRLDETTSSVTVAGDPDRVQKQALYQAIQKTVYQARTESHLGRARRPRQPHPRLRAAACGLAAGGAVIGFYLGLITWTSDWFYASAQFARYRWWIGALAVGLGLQVSLFVYMRAVRAAARLTGAASGMVASGGMSGVSMALCCSHYLAAVLPLIGLPFLSGAMAGLAEHQTLFFALGVLSNVLGVAYMVRLMRRSGVWDAGAQFALSQ